MLSSKLNDTAQSFLAVAQKANADAIVMYVGAEEAENLARLLLEYSDHAREMENDLARLTKLLTQKKATPKSEECTVLAFPSRVSPAPDPDPGDAA